MQPAEPAFLETIEPAFVALRESGAALRGLLRRRSSSALAPRRRRVLLAGGALVVAAAVAGCLLVPSAPSAPAAAASASPRASPTPGALTAPAPSPAPSDPALDGDDQALRGDDPVRAAAALVTRRERCLRSHDVACLETVDQWNGPSVVADRALLTSGHGDPLGGLGALRLDERLGATALLTGDATGGGTTKPVSLLLVKGETGWRIRSYRVAEQIG